MASVPSNIYSTNTPDTELYKTIYDDHLYPKFDTSLPPEMSAYIADSCNQYGPSNPMSEPIIIVGEWSISVASNVQDAWDPTDPNIAPFYTNWFAAQVTAYERASGWIFWGWKQQLNDPRWGYQAAVQSGLIPADLTTIAGMAACG